MADKKFTLTFDVEGNIGPIKGAIQNFQSVIKKTDLKIPVGIQGNIDKVISKLNAEIEEFENITSQGFANMSDISKAEKSFTRINGLMKQLGEYGKQIHGIDPQKFLPKKVIDRTEKLQKALDKLSDISLADEANTEKIEAQTEAIKKQQEEVEKLKTKYNALAAENKTSGVRKGNLSSSIKAKEKEAEAIKKQMEALEKIKGGKTSAEYQQLNAQFKNLTKTIRTQKDEFNSLDVSVNKNKTIMSGLKVQLDSAQNSLNQMNEQLKLLESDMGSTEELENLRKELALLKDVDIDQIPTDLEELKGVIDSLNDKPLEKIEQSMEGIEEAAKDLTPAAKKAADSLDNLRAEGKELTRTEQEIENLKNQVLDFFSITNTIQIFKNAVRDAFDTVKELDAAMTETAVVTDFSVGDMWDKLPEYSEEATKLGASIKSLYEATTLYYQQGLQTKEAMEVGIETMKMARIANMDAAQATEAMTAALRGFNMEINETSATRINDVYSELAAVTAADTSQIATAMGKTASIASSANMEFETTAALLAQIIETTQEAPETAGTAMKTIIARFTEVKELFSQGLLTGEDSEGETIEINKIDAALKTVGISLKDFLTGTKGIDDIFLELASKWNTLDLATQRYIATTAAGSRQQSRFLAMMGNYDRTMELVNAATNSAGASQKQFDKTLESLDAKLQRLENAWAEFTMGLANSDVIKWVVDLLTDLIEGVNKLTGLTGNDGLGGIITMFIRLGTVIGALKGGQAIITGLIKTISSTFGKPKFLENLTSGMSSGKMGLLQAFLVKKKGAAGGFGKFTTEAKIASKTIDEVKAAFGAAGHGAKGFLSILGRFAPYIAIFSALGFVISKMIKSFQAAQKQTQIDNLNSSMEELTSQSEQAQTKMEEIADSRNKLDNLNKTLNNLTRGTAEWKKSLFEANNEVLKLIETYPILSNEIAFGTSGQMIIKESGWEALLDQQQRVITNLTNAKIAISAQKATLEKGLAFEQFVTTSGAAYAGTDRQRIDWNAFMYNADLIHQANENQQVVDLTELKEVLVPDTEQTKLEEKLIDAQIKMANWMDTPAGAAMAAANDALLSNDLATSAGASLGKAIADWLGISFMSSTPNQDLHKEVMNGDGYSKQVYEDLLGLTEEQYLLLAETFYDKGITISEDMDTAIFDAVYNELQLPAKALEQVRTAALATANEFNELAKTAGEYSVQEKRLNNQFVSNTIANSSIGGLEYAEAISNFVSSSKKYDEELDKKLEEEKANLEKTYKENGKDLEDKTLEQRYADVMGYFVSNGKIYTDGTYSTQVNADREAMIEAIANANITLQIEKDALQVANLLEGKGERQKSLFNDLFSSEGKGITQSEISKYWNNGILNIATLTRDLGMSLEEIAGSFGGSVVEVGNLLSSNMIMAMDRIDKQRRDLAKRMTKYSTDKNITFNDNMNILSGLEEKFGEQIRYALEDVFNSLDKTGDFSIISQGFEFFKNTAITGTQQEVDQLTKFIEQINWSDPIDAAYKLNKELAYGSELTKGFAQAVNSLDSSFLGAGAQFESLFSSEIFKDIDEDLTKILEDQNIITEADIAELASEYSQLEKLIKNTSVTTKGLAKILTSIKKGDLSFENLTDAVIAALGGMNGLDEATGKVLTRLEKLDLGQDYGEVQKTYTELGEKIEEFQQQGDYGNPQYKAALDYAYGKGWEGDATGEDLINRYKELGDHFEKTLGKNMWYAWADAAKGVDVFGQSLEENAINKLKQLEEQGFSLDFINGESILEIPDDWTFDQTAENLSSVFSGTKELWEDLLTWFGGKDPNFRRSWEKAEYEQMGARVAQAETTKIGDKKIITEQEVQEISAEVQASLEFDEKSVEEVERDLREQLESNDVEILAIVETGDVVTDAQNIINQLNTAFGEGGLLFVDSFITQAENGLASLDLTGIITAINSLPISEELSTELINSLVSSTLGAVDQITYLLDGVPMTIKTSDITKDTNFVGMIKEAETAVQEAELDTTATVTIDQTIWQKSVRIAENYINKVFGNMQIPLIISAEESKASTEQNKTSSNSSSGKKPSGGGKFDKVSFAELAEGTKKHPKTELALTGEEGPELVETKEGAYLTGVEGPQMAYIKRGDTVHTAEETQAIYKRKGIAIPAYKGGSSGSLPGGGDSSSDESEEPWENSFDKLYNLIREIDEELRQRERIERRYEKLLENLDASADKILKVSYEELAQLESERALQEQLVQDRRTQISQYQAENSDLNKYASVTQNERGEDVLRINWDLIDSITDTDKGGRVEDYVNQLEEWFESLEEAEDALWEIEDAVADIRDRGKDEYFELEEAIKDALVQSYQDEIEKLDAINTSINDTNASLMDSIQKTLDKQRQERDNQRTEEDLAEKQRRLLYLQQDTSGANDLAILELQKEIAQGQEDYTDSLIDQKISELQEQNDEAARQREQQISLLQAQLDHYIRFGEIWGEVYNLMDEGLDKDKGLVRGSRLEELLKTSAGFSGMSTISQMEWLKETNSLINQALVYLELGRQLEDIGVTNQDIEVILPDGTTVKGTVDDKGNVTTKDGKTYSNVYQGADGRYYVGDTSTQNPPAQPEPPKEQQPTPAPEQKPAYPNNTEDNITGIAEAIWIHGQDTSGWGAGEVRKSRVDTKIGPGAGDKVQNKINQIASGKVTTGKAKKSLSEYYYKKFKYGGLADFTGPAWLDGTKARPELVLNSKDTQNFIQLKDILASLMTRPNSSSENNGDITYDIDINVESIGSDYDVEQVANKVKSLINQDARYRNNNSVSLMR